MNIQEEIDFKEKEIETMKNDLEILESELEELENSVVAIDEFINEHREEIIESLILANCLTQEFIIENSKNDIDIELEDWILNDESLYKWAISENVDI